MALISVPYDYTGQDVSTLLGAEDLKMALWNQDSYALYPDALCKNLNCGKAYFLKLSQKAVLMTKGAELNKAVPSRITLNDGWNMIGDPFTGDSIPWANCKVEVDQTQYSMTEAVTKGFVREMLWEYNTGTGSYQSSQQLQP